MSRPTTTPGLASNGNDNSRKRGRVIHDEDDEDDWKDKGNGTQDNKDKTLVPSQRINGLDGGESHLGRMMPPFPESILTLNQNHQNNRPFAGTPRPVMDMAERIQQNVARMLKDRDYGQIVKRKVNRTPDHCSNVDKLNREQRLQFWKQYVIVEALEPSITKEEKVVALWDQKLSKSLGVLYLRSLQAFAEEQDISRLILLITNKLTAKAKDYVRFIRQTSHIRWEIFPRRQFFNYLLDHHLVVRHRRKSPEEEEKFLDTEKLTKEQLPRLQETDVVAMHYSFPLGTIVDAIGPSGTNGLSKLPRVVSKAIE